MTGWASPRGGELSAGRARADGRAGDRVSALVRGLVGAAIFGGGLYVYTVVQGLATPDATSATTLDGHIPFVPSMMIAYLLFFPFVVVAAFAAGHERFQRIVVAGVVAAVVGWTCFLLFPASLDRPDPATVEDPLLQALFVWLHGIDSSHNTFPSLHVAVTWIACLGFLGTRAFGPALVAGALICTSTLFVKQHTVLDVIGGTVLALASAGVVEAFGRRSLRLRTRAGRARA